MTKQTPDSAINKTLCRMCDDHCGLNVYLDDHRIVNIDGLAEHPWNEGRVCAKARAAIDLVYAPDRIVKPLKKTDSGWQEIGLEEALDEIAEKLKAIKEKDGARSISIWKGEAVGFAQQEDFARRFCHALGTPNYLSNDSECFAGRYMGYTLVAGTLPPPDYANSRCIVLWGANPPYAHPNMTRMIMEARRKGAYLAVIDTRLSAIARKSDLHLPLKPGTDGILALGIANLLIERKQYDHEFVEKYSVGFEKYAAYVRQFSLEYVARETGVEESKIVKLVDMMAQRAPQVANYVGNGLEHHENGVNNVRAVACLDGLLGSLDNKGGNLMPEGFDMNCLTLHDQIPLRHLDPIGADKFPVLYESRHECHTMTAMDTILSGERYPLKAMIITAANPVMTNPNSTKVIKALESLELLVVKDLFMTETAKLADYVIPAASFLERSEIFSHRLFQIVGLTKKVVSFPECQDEYMFWHDLAHRLGLEEFFPWKDETEVNEWLMEPSGISLDTLKEHPQGYQYKPLRYRKWKEQPLNTPSGKFEFASSYLKEKGYPELPEYRSPSYLTEKSELYPFTLITGARKLLFYHSRNHNFKRFLRAIPGPEVEIHPNDAAELGINDGDMLKVTSEIGSIEIPAKIMANVEIVSGFLQITHGWKEANVNLITPDAINDPISGFPLLKAVPVSIEKVKR
jgi:formate dehydrogenase (coenzyme F420) alpha subunit